MNGDMRFRLRCVKPSFRAVGMPGFSFAMSDEGPWPCFGEYTLPRVVDASREGQVVATLRRPDGPAMDLGNYDALVVGGGLSGWAAAVTLARAGKDVLLAAERTALGHEVWGALSLWPGADQELPASPLMREVLDGLSEVNAVQRGALDPVATQVLLERLASEAGVKLLLQVWCHREKNGRAIVTGKWGTMSASARVFVDGTRSGSFALEAGATSASRDTDEPPLRRAFLIEADYDDDALLAVGDDLPVAGGKVRARRGVWPGDVILEAGLELDSAGGAGWEAESRQVMGEVAARLRSQEEAFSGASLVQVAYDPILPRDEVAQGSDGASAIQLAALNDTISVTQGALLPAGSEGLVLASPAADLGEITAVECYEARNAVRIGEASAAVAGQLLEE